MGAIPMKRSDIVADAILNSGEAEAGMPAFDSRVRIVSHMWCGQFVAAIGSDKSDAAASTGLSAFVLTRQPKVAAPRRYPGGSQE
jgi:hypothetical protein